MNNESSPQFSYKYEMVSLAADIVIFSVVDQKLKVMLVRRGVEPELGSWALPGGHMKPDETIEECAQRELLEETGINLKTGRFSLENVGIFSEPARDIRVRAGFENQRNVSAAFMALIPEQELSPVAGDDAASVKWVQVERVPDLAFDHNRIIERAHALLQERMILTLGKSKNSTFEIASKFLGERFTIAELKQIYDVVLGDFGISDMSNFRKWVKINLPLEQLDISVPTGRRHAKLFRFKKL